MSKRIARPLLFLLSYILSLKSVKVNKYKIKPHLKVRFYDSRRADLGELYDEKDIDTELTADLVGDYLFTDSDFINNLSTKNRNVFQKIYDEIKYLCKIATAGSKEVRELEKVKKAFEKAYKESGTINTNTQYSVSFIDKYSQKQYNNFGWARDAEAISKNELDDLYLKNTRKRLSQEVYTIFKRRSYHRGQR